MKRKSDMKHEVEHVTNHICNECGMLFFVPQLFATKAAKARATRILKKSHDAGCVRNESRED